ncbi:MAG: serine/threonine-protein kinase [Pirellulaceae bacterium]|jgi:serine/threonine-protein kinase|nr:serine/threonine-protein kinase [Pirellulaceae bacterium]MDP6721913.1 serine/threonine-protein kinase [Pirellulaceae bacterium]
MSQRTDVSHASRGRLARAATSDSVGKWQLLQLIGQGEWTHVYRSHPQQGGPDAANYAVKILKPQFQNDSLAISLLRREALVASQVRHVHLTSVLSHHTHSPPYFLVSPYLAGVSLRAALRVAQRLTIPHALWIARQAAEALEALHRRGWRHADVKPENVLIGPNGHATLLDLGFAESIRDAVRGDVIKGSPAYWSPESCCDELPCGTASDIYSLGVTLYESLTGRCPFVEASASAMATAHVDAELPDPRVLVPQMGPRVARLLRAMLAKSAIDRPTSKQLIDRLVDLEIDTLPERVPA